ncbi:hypothetical protein L9W92_10845 [Pelotomaculum terephthalicicum JT]|uniref:hypothetical protein n=1 Tax=Pelotomaculum terephthalicicum TaxID=206393 RepID=UPI001F037516|nr:hypothetical protein [Pelotomaculum terephthalicicum]MCG9968550.1 hypothetical protein [Pelotomaculum terephthalicicum JT]
MIILARPVNIPYDLIAIVFDCYKACRNTYQSALRLIPNLLDPASTFGRLLQSLLTL